VFDLKKRPARAKKKQCHGHYFVVGNTSRRGIGKGKHSKVSSDLRADLVEAMRPGKRKLDFTTHAAIGTPEKN
jgi:hypothetical protein